MSATVAKSCGAPTVYHRRQPERTVLYRVVQAHLATWLALHDGGCGGHAPVLTEHEFRRYLECGTLAHGFARARCPDCGHDFIIAYSCKGRGICPSCTTRRMVETAAHLTDHVFPRLPVRQWVLSLPKRLRYPLDDAQLQNAVLHSFLHGIEQGLREACPKQTAQRTPTHTSAPSSSSTASAVCSIPTWLCIPIRSHFHVVMIDGVFCEEEAGHLHFLETCLTAEQMAHLQRTIR